MWVIRRKNFKYQVGYYIKLGQDYLEFEVFATFENKENAIALCSRLNGGQ